MRVEVWVFIRIIFVVLIYWFVFQAIRASRIQMLKSFETNTAHDSQATRHRNDRPVGLLRVRDPADCDELKKDQEIWFNGSITLGRRDSVDLRLVSSTVSQQHAQIVRNTGNWWIVDLHSTNGTFLNEESVIGRKRLQTGDQIRVGEVRFVFEG